MHCQKKLPDFGKKYMENLSNIATIFYNSVYLYLISIIHSLTNSNKSLKKITSISQTLASSGNKLHPKFL